MIRQTENQRIPYISTALGAQVTLYQKPGFLAPAYGEHPAGLTVFLRLRAEPKH